MKPRSLRLSLLLAVIGIAAIPGPIGAAEPDALARSTQVIAVTTSDWNAVEGRLQRYQRATPHQPWRPVGAPISIVVGKSGLGWGLGIIPAADPEVRGASGPVKKEGDGKAPAGVFALGTAFGYAPEPLRGSKLPYLYLAPSVECVDDTASRYYNSVLDRSTVAPDWNSSEHMLRPDELYRWGIVVDHNRIVAQSKAPVPGGGSCIFLHIWRGPGQGTVGCTAMPQAGLESLLAWLDPERQPLLVQLPLPEYERLSHRWQLPALVHVPPR